MTRPITLCTGQWADLSLEKMCAHAQEWGLDGLELNTWGHFDVEKALKDAIAELVRKYHLKKQTVTCELWTLSGFLRRYDVRRVDLLKIDAEQSERHILAGLAEKDWPKVRQVIVEVHEGEEATRAVVGLLLVARRPRDRRP